MLVFQPIINSAPVVINSLPASLPARTALHHHHHTRPQPMSSRPSECPFVISTKRSARRNRFLDSTLRVPLEMTEGGTAPHNDRGRLRSLIMPEGGTAPRIARGGTAPHNARKALRPQSFCAAMRRTYPPPESAGGGGAGVRRSRTKLRRWQHESLQQR